MDVESTGRPADPTGSTGAVVRLTSGQRRALAALLQQVARAVELLEASTGGPLEERLTFVERLDDLTETERRGLRETGTALVREANAVAATSRVEPRATSARARLSATFNMLWIDAEECRDEKLEGYGPVAPEVRTLLGPRLTRLSRLSLRLADLAAGKAARNDEQQR